MWKFLILIVATTTGLRCNLDQVDKEIPFSDLDPELFWGVQIQRRNVTNSNICATGSFLVRKGKKRYVIPNFQCNVGQNISDSLHNQIEAFAVDNGIDKENAFSFVEGYSRKVIETFYSSRLSKIYGGDADNELIVFFDSDGQVYIYAPFPKKITNPFWKRQISSSSHLGDSWYEGSY